MLIPRFSLRWLFAFFIVASATAYAARQAVFGEAWGVAVLVTLVAVGLMFAAYIIVFAGAWVFGTFVSLLFSRTPTPESPFASSKVPPQVLAPISPDVEE